MKLEFSLLSSGSRANCIYVASPNTRVLIDCGLSGRETEHRLRQIGRSFADIDAIVLTHEHSDHVRGLAALLKKRAVPIWGNSGTWSGIRELGGVESSVCRRFNSDAEFEIGDLRLSPFRVSHDANDPVMFRIASGPHAIAIATDLGYVTPPVLAAVRDVDALILESNHDLEMLQTGPYPWYLKQRIRGERGHLSNCAAAALLAELGAAFAARSESAGEDPVPGQSAFARSVAAVSMLRDTPSADSDGAGSLSSSGASAAALAFSAGSVRSSSQRRLRAVIGAHVSEKNNTRELAYSALAGAWKRAGADYTPELLIADAFAPTPLICLALLEAAQNVSCAAAELLPAPHVEGAQFF